jgi:hypothetical protein
MGRKKKEDSTRINRNYEYAYIVMFGTDNYNRHPVAAFKSKVKAETYIYDVEERWGQKMNGQNLFIIAVPFINPSEVDKKIKEAKKAVEQEDKKIMTHKELKMYEDLSFSARATGDSQLADKLIQELGNRCNESRV